MERRQIKLLPFHPSAPVPISRRKKNNGANQQLALNASASNQFTLQKDRADFWNTTMKNRIDELQILFIKEQESNLMKTAAIKCLHQNIRRKNAKILSLKMKCEKNQEKMRWLKHRCKIIHKTVPATKNVDSQTEPYEIGHNQSTNDKSGAMDEENSMNQGLDSKIGRISSAPCDQGIQMASVSTQFTTTLNNSRTINPSATTNRQPEIQMPHSDHTYAMRVQNKKRKTVYRCDKCSYWTTKKSSMTDHQAEYCKQSKLIRKKDVQCPGCPKKFSRLGLRLHLNYYKRAQKTHAKAA